MTKNQTKFPSDANPQNQMNWRTLPDAPDSVKYHGGYDPSDPPFEADDMMECDCGHRDYEEEVTFLSDKSVCVNCILETKNSDHTELRSHEETSDV